MTQPRLLLDLELRAGVTLDLDEAQVRHVGTVLRLSEGDALRGFNARDGEWLLRVAARRKHALTVRVESFIRPSKPTPDLDLLFAPVKRHATDLIVEKATELGVRRIRPVITQRTIAETVRVERLALIAREAAEQTERFDAPEIAAPTSLSHALDQWEHERPLVYADEAGDDVNAPWGGERGRAQPILDALTSLSPRPGQMALLVGPEGGFTPDERRALRSMPFVVPVSLGPRILRAETAVIATLSIIQAAWGDWTNG